MKVSIIGAGYVGLVSGVCLAEKGHEVVCVDNDILKVNKINLSISPIYEDGLDELLLKNIENRFSASVDLTNAVINSDVSLLAVGTPFDGNEIDLKYVRQVAKEIGIALKEKNEYHVVVVKSTVVPGTTDKVVIPILEKYSGKKSGVDFGVGMNPEFLREGSAIYDFMNPDRIVLGAIDSKTHRLLSELYFPFSDVSCLKTNNKTAEMIKYTSNSFLATLISFSNEVGNLCSSIGEIDSLEVMEGVILDKRISTILDNGDRIVPSITSYLEAGCGFGGSCLPKDVKALIKHGERHDQSMLLLKSVVEINYKQPFEIIDTLKKYYPDFNGLKISVLGLAFKPGTDDMRESPAIPIINKLQEGGAVIRAYDPVAEEEAKLIFKGFNIRYCSSINSVLNEAQVILLLTRWPEFSDLPEIIKTNRIDPVVIDGRRMLPKNIVSRYEGIGS
ncbi:MAG: UDP-glucose/GDP-mannose dehydrogenase family protein [Gammaproteobacteria bacterium]|jgi:UDPglucose 6-dehydrogenase|nr:UDP-glucose/GDP-mannose dehydrogenase family protein [Gammaproteobacteria bacterium]